MTIATRRRIVRLGLVIAVALSCVTGGPGRAVDVGCARPVPLQAGVPYRGDTTGGPLNVSSYGCSAWGEAGPEVVHSITTSMIQTDITATLSNLGSNDLDVFMLLDQECESDRCVAGNVQATITRAAPGTHFIVVDGYGLDEFGARGPYTLTVDAVCSSPIDLVPGVPYDGETNGGPPNNVSGYSCSSWNESGPELIHRLTTSEIANIRAEISNLEGDLDVFIVSSCNASACLAFGDSVAQLDSAPPGTYYIVVDGYDGAMGAYTLTVTTSGLCDGVTCNDGNLCTTDACDPSIGCVFAPIVCNDGELCTTDQCNPENGLCEFTPVECNDGDLCTHDTCNPENGQCEFPPVECNDGNLCTHDTCNPENGECVFSWVCSPPEITSTPPTEATLGEPYLYPVEADDPDGHSLSYFLADGPEGMTVGLTSGLVEWLPGELDLGPHAVSIIVEDETGAGDTQDYILTVLDPRFVFAGQVLLREAPGLDTPAPGVLVELHGDFDLDPYNGTYPIDGDVTDAAGEFAISWKPSDLFYPTLHLIEYDAAGTYSFDAATGSPAQVQDLNTITFLDAGLQPGLYDGNVFRDAPIGLRPEDFDASADVIDFDTLAAGEPITLQLNSRGVALRTGEGGLVVVADSDTIAPEDAPVSLPNVALSEPPEAALVIELPTPRSKVGLTLLSGRIPESFEVQVSGFDVRDELVAESFLVMPDEALRPSDAVFAGVAVAQPEIARVTVELLGASGAKLIDDLMLEPSQEETVSVEQEENILRSPDSSSQEKLDAIDDLQLVPSARASAILHDVAVGDPDLYVRERAIMALTQIRDPDSIAVLSQIGLTPPNDAIRLAAYNAVFTLRQLFPIAVPPQVTLEVTSEVALGLEIDAVATIVSPVEREFVQIRFATGKGLRQLPTEDTALYKGALLPGEPLVLRARFVADEEGKTAIKLFTRINLDKVDATTFTEVLYLDVQPGSGTVSATPFADQIDVHVLPIDAD